MALSNGCSGSQQQTVKTFTYRKKIEVELLYPDTDIEVGRFVGTTEPITKVKSRTVLTDCELD